MKAKVQGHNLLEYEWLWAVAEDSDPSSKERYYQKQSFSERYQIGGSEQWRRLQSISPAQGSRG